MVKPEESAAHYRGARAVEDAQWPRLLVVCAASYAVLGGLVTLSGWALDAPRLTDWKNDGISMFPNPSVCAVLGGVVLVLLDRPSAGLDRPSAGRRTLVRVLSVILLALGGLTLLEHLTGANFGIDTLLFDKPFGQVAAAAPMRMGPPASTSFLLLGIALLLATFGERARNLGAGLAVTVCAIAMLSLIGHLYGAKQMYGQPSLTGIAMQTASIILALAAGTIASARDREPMRTMLTSGAAGTLARRALPVIVLVAGGLGWLRVQAQQRGWVDTAFGTAARTVIEMLLLVLLLWRAMKMVREHEEALRRSTAEIRHQAKQLAAFLDTAAIALHRVGPDGTILWANEAELHMLGYARAEYLGHAIGEFHVDAEVHADLLARLHRGEKLVEYESRMRCRDGSVKSVLIDSSVLWDEGRFVHTQCFTRDVTDRLRADAEREEANRRKDEFMAILGHELRNPLGPIRNAAHFLELKEFTDPDSRRSVETIERQVAQMARLLDDLLDVSRLTRGTLELRRARVDLADVVERAVEACSHEIEARRHRLRTSLPQDPVELYADRDRLVQVLCNLIGNATKYTAPGGTIDLAVLAGGRDLEISVRDTGVGIPRENLKTIFELFARVDRSEQQREGGLGIGLTLVRQIVELHGGTIEARSDGAERGSEFVLKLPIVASAAKSSTDGHPSPASASAAACRILVADDNPDAVETLRLILKAGGHDVRTALDGEAAIRIANEFLPNVALVDLGMPKLNGYEVAERIRSQPWGAAIHLVALTGWGQEADRRRGLAAGFDAHFVKPVAPEVLRQMLASIRPLRSGIRVEARPPGRAETPMP